MWMSLDPPLRSATSRRRFGRLAQALKREQGGSSGRGRAREQFAAEMSTATLLDRQTLTAAGLVICDLAAQGWRFRMRNGKVEVRPPEVAQDPHAEKDRVRQQELVKRDAQLVQAPVRRFVAAMERSREFGGAFCSIFSLMRDGRELADALRSARGAGGRVQLHDVIDPYIEFVSSEEATCSHTGLRLVDIWRYFRHTWSNQYKSVPGRSMMFLVRDRAAPFHPVVGIGALSSPVMQIRERDLWIGWHPDAFLEEVTKRPTLQVARWLVRTVAQAIDEIYLDDFVDEGVVSLSDLDRPSAKVIARLLRVSKEQRTKHHRFVRSRDHKTRRVTDDRWVTRARLHLFRSKRALALSMLLKARLALNSAFGDRPTAAKLRDLLSSRDGTEAVRMIVRKAKGDRVGIAVADISVCGAVQPYNAILGGKLVAMLATSPEVVAEYRRRYARAESEIASSVAGRPIVRPPQLVLLGTTSLYGVGSSQYNRIRIPCSRLGGMDGREIRYVDLGHSEAFGTSQYLEDTVKALAELVRVSKNGARVNSIFGEGTSPKLRKIRHGLEVLGFPANELLRHHRHRVVYAVSLVENLREILLGIDRHPRYVVSDEDPSATTRLIAGWWRERWLQNRILSEDVLEEVARHSLVRPVRHGARVRSLEEPVPARAVRA